MASAKATAAAKEWVSGLSGSTQKIKDGVMNVREAPGIAAARKKDKMRMNLLAAIDDGTWERAVSSVTLQQWQDRFLKVGVDRIAQGAAASESKMAMALDSVLAYQDNLREQIKSMPDLTPEQRIQRMVTFVRGMMEYRKP